MSCIVSMILQFCCHCINEFYFKSKRSFKELVKVSDKESSITLSMYLGVKWEDSRIRNINQTVEDLQVSKSTNIDQHQPDRRGFAGFNHGDHYYTSYHPNWVQLSAMKMWTVGLLSTPKNGQLGSTVRGPNA